MRRLTTFLLLSIIASLLLSRYGNSFGIGTLPGDFTVQGDGRIWHIPLGSCILASIVLSVIWTLLRKLRR